MRKGQKNTNSCKYSRIAGGVGVSFSEEENDFWINRFNIEPLKLNFFFKGNLPFKLQKLVSVA